MMTTQSTNQISSAKPFRLLTNYYFPSLLTQSGLVIVAPPSATHFLYWVSNWLITSKDESPLCLIILIVSMIDSQLANPVEAPCNQSFDTFLFPTKKHRKKLVFVFFAKARTCLLKCNARCAGKMQYFTRRTHKPKFRRSI